MAEAGFTAGEVSFHRAKRPVKERGDFGVREALLISEMQRETFVGVEGSKCGGEIVVKIRFRGLRRHRGFAGVGVFQCRVRPGTPSGIAPVVVGDAEQPGRKGRATVETREAAPGVDEGLLRQIVGERGIAMSEMAEELAHGGLVALDEEAERGAIIAPEGAGNQLCVAHERGVGSRSESGCLRRKRAASRA